jgi:predicted TPR repeat methyltransferase
MIVMSDSIEQIKKSAAYFLEEGNHQEARALYERLCELNPNDANCLALAGILNTRCKLFSKAKTYLEKAIQADPNFLLAYVYFADLLVLNKDYAKALDLLAITFEIDSGYGLAYEKLGDVLSHTQKHLEAERAYIKAISCLPPALGAFLKLADLYEQSKENDKSLNCYLEYIKHFPNDITGLQKLGYFYNKQGRFKKAIECFKKSLEINPQQPTVSFNIGVAYQALGQIDDAIKQYIDTISLFPDHGKSYANLGYLMYGLGKHDKAREHLRYADILMPNNPQIRHMLAATGGVETPQAASKEYVKTTFDNYADNFESHLINKLHYRTHEYLLECFLDASSNDQHLSLLLDLGCGSGLCGQLFKPYVDNMTGVDISPNMIKKAQEKDIYTTLEIADICDYLDKSDTCFDIILSGDVFVYIGDLEKIFEKCSNHLRCDGLFIFSVEKSDNQQHDYMLQASGRYTQSEKYIRGLAKNSGYSILIKREKALRLQDNLPVLGMLFVLQKKKISPNRKNQSNII